MGTLNGTRGNHPIGDRAVVVGASMAGLSAARVLADRFGEVVVVDRDRLDGDDPRGQVPQGRHPHLLLVAGARLLERWFPGLGEELEAGGARPVDICRDISWYQSGGVQRRPASALCGPSMSRPFLEATVRRRVEAIPNVTFRRETAVEGLDTDDERTRITGVRLGDGSTLTSNLVVDATGRPARSLAWIEALGYEPPPTSMVHVDTRYVSRVFRRTDDPARDWEAAAAIGDPASKRLAMALPIEGNRWIVMLGGLNGESPPTDDADMLAYARSLGSPTVADIIEASDPIGPPATHRFPANQRRHVERLRRYPTGWVLLGDAVCSFDPIYGQGMTSAAMQAAVLGETLDRAGGIDRAFARAYFRKASRVVKDPWSIAVGGDFAYEGTTGKKPPGTDLFNRYFERIAVASQHDDAVVIRTNEVLTLTRGSGALLTPPFVLRVLRKSRRGPADSPVRPPPHADEEISPVD